MSFGGHPIAVATMSICGWRGHPLPSGISVTVAHPNAFLLSLANRANRCGTAADNYREDDDQRLGNCNGHGFS